MTESAKQNTDREIYREKPDDYYSDSIFVTQKGAIGINCGGHVRVHQLREWFNLAGMKTFRISDKNFEKIQKWSEEQDKIVMESGKAKKCRMSDGPYYGPTGGVITYCFTPTSIGLIIEVEHGITKNKYHCQQSILVIQK